MYVDIKGLPGIPIIDGVDFSKFTAEEHKKWVQESSPHNYHQIPGWLVEGLGSNNWSLLLRRTLGGKEEVKEVLDFQAMYSTLNAGVINQTILQTMRVFLNGRYPPAIPRAIDHLFLAPANEAVKKNTGMDMIIMKSGGAEAVETACNIASQFWYQKNKSVLKSEDPSLVVPDGCFHGRTRLARSLSSSVSARVGFGPLVPHIIHIPYGDAEALRRVLASHRNLVAGFIVEPIQGEAGVIIPPKGYLKKVSELCKEYDVLLILDEIQTGFGRTGSDWVFEREDVKPDLLCGGKADGGGIVPVSFVAGRKEVMSVIQPGTEGATWSGTPIQCVALMAAIKELSDNNLSKQSKEKGEYFLSLLKDLAHKYPHRITEIRGVGLFVGVDTIHDGKKLSVALLEEGLWAKETGEYGQTLRFSPPLIIPKDELARAVLIFEKALLRLEH